MMPIESAMDMNAALQDLPGEPKLTLGRL